MPLNHNLGVKRPIAGSIPHIPTVDLDDTEVTPIGSAKTNVSDFSG